MNFLLNSHNCRLLIGLIPVLAGLLGFSMPALAQIVEPEEWSPPLRSVPAFVVGWGFAIDLPNMRIQDRADEIDFDLLREDTTFGDSPRSIATARLSPSGGSSPSAEALIVAADDGIFVAENRDLPGYTALGTPNRFVRPDLDPDPDPNSEPNPDSRRVIVFDLDGDGVNDIVDAEMFDVSPTWSVRFSAGPNYQTTISASLAEPAEDLVQLPGNRFAVVTQNTLWFYKLQGSPGRYDLSVESKTALSSLIGARLTTFALSSGLTGIAVLGESTVVDEGVKMATYVDDGNLSAGSSIVLSTNASEPVDLAAVNLGDPDQGMVIGLSGGDTPGELAFLRTTLDSLGRPVVSEAFTSRIALEHIPTVIVVADFSRNQDRIPDILVGATSVTKDQLFLLAFEGVALGTYPSVGVTRALTDPVTDSTPQITEIAVGQLNDDQIPDVAVTVPDYQGNGRVFILRGAPPPCAVAVTGTVHGHLGAGSAFHNPLPEVMAVTEFNQAGAERVLGGAEVGIMDDRRPVTRVSEIGDPDFAELCSIGHIAVDGRWEGMTAPGALLMFVGRGGWLVSWLVPFPGLHFPANGSPKVFWTIEVPATLASAIIAQGHFTLRMGALALGTGAEHYGRIRMGRSSRIAASNLAAAIDEAVTRARAAMDPCTGTVIFDLIGHSRGTPQINAAAQLLSGPTRDMLDHFAAASITYLDAIDPITEEPGFSDTKFGPDGDAIRPWGHSGAFVGDPWIARIGNEVTSDLRYSTAVPAGLGFVSWIVNRGPTLNPIVDLNRDIIGTPVGHNRAGTTFLNQVEAGDTFVRSLGTHNDGIDLMKAAALAPNEYGAGHTTATDFHFQYLSGIGRLYPQASGHQHQLYGPRAILFPDAMKFGGTPDWTTTGWIKAGSPGEGSSHIDRYPTECQPGTEPKNEAPSIGDLYRPLTAYWREFVDDSFLSSGASMVRGATEMVNSDKFDLLLLPEMPELHDEIGRIAVASFSNDGVWVQNDRPSTCETKPDRKCASMGTEDSDTLLDIALAKVLGPFSRPSEDVHNPKHQDAIVGRYKADIESMIQTDQQNLADQTQYLAAAVGGGHSGFNNYLDIDAGSEVVQLLNLLSTAEKELLVRVEFMLLDKNSSLDVYLEGHQLEAHLTESSLDGWGVRRRDSVVAIRARSGITSVPDAIRLIGHNVRVYRISVIPTDKGPQTLSFNNHVYEVVALPEGSDAEEAAALASRMEYNGRQGELATFDATLDLEKVLADHKAAGYYWVNAQGNPNVPSSYVWTKTGTLVSKNFIWNSSDTFPPIGAQTHSVFAYPDGTLGHALATSRHDGVPMGFIVDYGKDP